MMALRDWRMSGLVVMADTRLDEAQAEDIITIITITTTRATLVPLASVPVLKTSTLTPTSWISSDLHRQPGPSAQEQAVHNLMRMRAVEVASSPGDAPKASSALVQNDPPSHLFKHLLIHNIILLSDTMEICRSVPPRTLSILTAFLSSFSHFARDICLRLGYPVDLCLVCLFVCCVCSFSYVTLHIRWLPHSLIFHTYLVL